MEQNVSTAKYIVIFSITFLMILIAMVVALTLLGMNSNSGLEIAALMAAAMYTALKFINENKRLPNRAEKKRLVWFSLLASWIVSLVLSGLFVAFTAKSADVLNVLSSLGVFLLAGVVAFVSLLYWGVLSLSYGYMARKQFESLQKKGKI